MSNQVRTIFLQWIPWVLRMARPGEKITRKTIMMQVSVTVAIKVQAIIGGSSVIVLANIDANSDHTVFQNKMKELDLKEKSSKSLLANVLDMDDDFVPSSSLPAHPPTHQKNGGFIRWISITASWHIKSYMAPLLEDSHDSVPMSHLVDNCFHDTMWLFVIRGTQLDL